MNHTVSLRHELCSELGKTLGNRALNNSLQSRVIICLWFEQAEIHVSKFNTRKNKLSSQSGNQVRLGYSSAVSVVEEKNQLQSLQNDSISVHRILNCLGWKLNQSLKSPGSKSPQISQNPRQAERCHFTKYTIVTTTKTMVQITLNSDRRFSSLPAKWYINYISKTFHVDSA